MATPNGWSPFGAAFDHREDEIKAVPDDALLPLNLDVKGAIAMVLGALPALSGLKDRFSTLPEIDQKQLEGLEEYAEAAAEANMRFGTATAPNDDIVALNDSAVKMRETLRTDATSLAKRGLIDSSRLSGLRGLSGYKNVGFELLGWASVMHDAWAQIQNKTPLTEQEIIQAKQLAEQLIRAAGVRDQTPATVAQATHIRQQAVTLMINAYDQARRAVSFLRWNEGDLETIAPSLYGGRVRRANDTTTTESGANPTSPTPAPVVTPNPGPTVPTGMPGAPSFVSH